MSEQSARVETGGTVHIVQQMEPGGIQTLILDMMGAAHHPGDRIYSLDLSREQLVADWPLLADHKARLFGFEKAPGLTPELVRRLRKSLRRHRPQTVILHHIGPLLYGSAAARLAGVPNIIHVEHDVWHYENRRHRWYAALSSRLFRPHFVAVSQQVADGMRPIIGDRKIHVIPPAIDTDRFRPGDKAAARTLIDLPGEVQVIGTAGRLEQVKAYDVLIEAVGRLGADVHLVLAGDGSQRESLRQLTDRLGLADRVHFLGLRADLDRLLPAFDLFCLSSHNEGLPRVVLEAQACGLPVVATDVGALKDALCPGQGRLAPPGDAEALAAALLQQLEASADPTAIRDFIVENYGIGSLMQAFERIVEAD